MTARLRCAVYTRKSTEEGLEQSFNSLDAQRESCEAYILSQAGEGWECLPEFYDDGGWSGGNMDRPALKRLLDDIGKGRVDVIVVYKVDRLTRSLMDFARIVEVFDTHKVSFVSVTQAFNTTSSMGRLTLNVLLSFAQFERDVTGERIRDKIAASKARGIWMGGKIPIGYDLGDRRLIPNEEEAVTVRRIFERYLALRSLIGLANELTAHGILTKRWCSRNGVVHGGIPFNCSGLSHILKNRLYLGEIVHRGKSHAGDHAAIVDQPLFDHVQAQLAANHHKRTTRKTRAATCPLAGKVFDSDGQPMRPSFSYGRGKQMYRYYVSESLLPQGKVGNKANRVGQRLAAEATERHLLRTLTALTPQEHEPDTVFASITRVLVQGKTLVTSVDTSLLTNDGLTNDMLLLRAREQIDPHTSHGESGLRMTIGVATVRKGKCIPLAASTNDDPERRSSLARLVRISHRKLAELDASPLSPVRHGAMRAPPNEWTRARVGIGLLAPDVQKALLQGTAPRLVGNENFVAGNLPLDWNEQRRMVGLIS